MRTGYTFHPVHNFKTVNRMGVYLVLIFEKYKPDGLVIQLRRRGVLLK